MQLTCTTDLASAPVVADLMARELVKDAAWDAQQVQEYRTIATGYLLPS